MVSRGVNDKGQVKPSGTVVDWPKRWHNETRETYDIRVRGKETTVNNTHAKTSSVTLLRCRCRGRYQITQGLYVKQPPADLFMADLRHHGIGETIDRNIFHARMILQSLQRGLVRYRHGVGFGLVQDAFDTAKLLQVQCCR